MLRVLHLNRFAGHTSLLVRIGSAVQRARSVILDPLVELLGGCVPRKSLDTRIGRLSSSRSMRGYFLGRIASFRWAAEIWLLSGIADIK